VAEKLRFRQTTCLSITPFDLARRFQSGESIELRYSPGAFVSKNFYRFAPGPSKKAFGGVRPIAVDIPLLALNCMIGQGHRETADSEIGFPEER
jgi:hypothetical protein